MLESIIKLFKRNKITIMRNKIKDINYLTSKYYELLREYESIKTFETFECSDFFRGYEKAKHNKKVLKIMRNKCNRQYKFICNQIKIHNTNFYLKYIGKISTEEMNRIKRKSKITKII